MVLTSELFEDHPKPLVLSKPASWADEAGQQHRASTPVYTEVIDMLHVTPVCNVPVHNS